MTIAKEKFVIPAAIGGDTAAGGLERAAGSMKRPDQPSPANIGKVGQEENINMSFFTDDWEKKVLKDAVNLETALTTFHVFQQNFDYLRARIRDCQFKQHVQQVAYSISHDSLTQVCFTCQAVRTCINVSEFVPDEKRQNLTYKCQKCGFTGWWSSYWDLMANASKPTCPVCGSTDVSMETDEQEDSNNDKSTKK